MKTFHGVLKHKTYNIYCPTLHLAVPMHIRPVENWRKKTLSSLEISQSARRRSEVIVTLFRVWGFPFTTYYVFLFSHNCLSCHSFDFISWYFFSSIYNVLHTSVLLDTELLLFVLCFIYSNLQLKLIARNAKCHCEPYKKNTMKPPFTSEQIQEWASLGPKVREKPTSPEQIAALKERKKRMNAMKKRLAKELAEPEDTSTTKPKWSERAIGCELDRLVERLTFVDTRPDYQKDNSHPDNIVDHRAEGGPLLEYLWCHDEGKHLKGQTLYLGGEVGADGKIYCIPGHAPKVLVIDDKEKMVYQIGPELTSNGRLYKWLRGIVVGSLIYGLPCHADEILRIDTSTGNITKIPIPYEEFYKEDAKAEREMIWKYHGGTICPLDGCIYAIPQRAHQVLKIDPKTEEISFVGPKFEGHCKWYGGIIGKQDGAIYGIPQNASGVLRIAPDSVTVHGNYGSGNHKWHGGAAAANGVIVSVPANANTVLCVTPGETPVLQEIGTSDTIQSGRHRSDGKYKYLGAMCGTNGKVYIFPCASEYVLQVDTTKMEAKNVGPNLRDDGLETVHQNKYQNGLACIQDECVYGITLSGHTLLRIDCSSDGDPEVTTWLLPSPRRECRDKFEGGVMTGSGVMYTVPNNHKGVLRIEPAKLSA